MMMVLREKSSAQHPLPQLIPWGCRAIAIVNCTSNASSSRRLSVLPSRCSSSIGPGILGASGELTSRRLPTGSSRCLLAAVSRKDYKTLIISMLENGFLEMTEEKGLIVGPKGERLMNSFKFYAVFKDTEDYTVRCGSDEIGVITSPPPVGDRFALAGRVWEVEELDIRRRLIYVRGVEGKMEISWPGDFGEIHTRILERMKQVLAEDKVYPYLKPNAAERLEVARHLARNTGMLERSLVCLGGYTWCLFPWLGTRSFRTLRKFLLKNSKDFKISNLDFEGCYYMTFRMERGDDRELIKYLAGRAVREGVDCASLVASTELPVFDKYDDYIPGELLQKAYAADRLRADEVERRLQEIAGEYE